MQGWRTLAGAAKANGADSDLATVLYHANGNVCSGVHDDGRASCGGHQSFVRVRASNAALGWGKVSFAVQDLLEDLGSTDSSAARALFRAQLEAVLHVVPTKEAFDAILEAVAERERDDHQTAATPLLDRQSLYHPRSQGSD